MPHYLSDGELKRVAPAEIASFRSPIPTQIVSNGEFNPLPQTRHQRRVEARVKDLAAELSRRHGMSRRQFLASSAGMAAAFLAMNEVFGSIFDVSRAEAAAPGVAAERAAGLAGQFIVDVQTHFVRDDFKQEGLLDLAKYARQYWNPRLVGENTLARYKFENYVREVFVDSDTKVALLSGAPFDDSSWDLLSNDQIAAARTAINRIAGSRRLLAHTVFTPKKPGWLNEVDRAIAQIRPDSWKGYTIGDPLFPSKLGSYWRLDDDKVAYFSWYAGGFRVVDITDPSNPEEVGRYIDAKGNDFWGVALAEDQDGNRIVLGSDRDFGLFIFRYTGPMP